MAGGLPRYQRLLHEAIAYSAGRRQSRQPIGNFRLMQAMQLEGIHTAEAMVRDATRNALLKTAP